MGTGGTGKTRLALETGAQLINEFRDGVWLAELALIAEPGRVVEAVAAAVGAREKPTVRFGRLSSIFWAARISSWCSTIAST